MPSVADCLKASSELATVSDSARLDTEILLAYVLKKDRSWLYTWPEKQIPADIHYQFLQLMSRRTMGEPIAYLTGRKGFWSLELEVNKTTLIPRPETELLVELALEKIPNTKVNVLDLGTGTGAIALAIAKERPNAKVKGVDCVSDAVELARRNAHLNNISNVEFIQSKWFENVGDEKFDLIVSNPPYIDSEDPHLLLGDIRFEPRSALISQEQGFADLRHIVKNAKIYLKRNAWLFVEHGWQQGKKMKENFSENEFSNISTAKDTEGRDRITYGSSEQVQG